MPVSLIPFLSLAVKHLGAGAIIAAVFGAATLRIYEDLGKRNDALIEIFREQTRSNHEVATALDALTRQLSIR